MGKIDLHEEIEIPEGIEAIIEGLEIILKKDRSELKRKLNPTITTKIEGNKIILDSKKASKKEKRILGTIKAHINNMILGLNEKFKYRLQIANVHFPMNVSIDKEKHELVVKNFLGEKIDRRVKLPKECDVRVEKDIIEIESENIEKAGQCAADIEKRTRSKNKDRRVYQDGIYIIEKPGRLI